MKQLADDVYVLEGFPPYAINVYLLGEILVDSGTRFAAQADLAAASWTNDFDACAHSCPSRSPGLEPCDL